MNNLWLLTEERPKPSVIEQIINAYCIGFDDQMDKKAEIRVKPSIENGISIGFLFPTDFLGVVILYLFRYCVPISTGTVSFSTF